MLTLAVVVLCLVVFYFGRRITRAVESSKDLCATDPQHGEILPKLAELRVELTGVLEQICDLQELVLELKGNESANRLDSPLPELGDNPEPIPDPINGLAARLEDVEDHLVDISANLCVLWALGSRGSNARVGMLFLPFERTQNQDCSFELERAAQCGVLTTHATSTRHAEAVEQVATAFLSENEYDENALRSIILAKLEDLDQRE